MHLTAARRALAITSLAPLVLSACATEADPDVLGPRGDHPPATLPPRDGAQRPPDDPRALASAAVADVEGYWVETYPEVYGGAFEPLDGYHPYGPDTPVPPCGDPPPTYDQIAENAFYCPGDDLIAWDEDALVPRLEDQFGPFTIGIVMAHEFAHAVQMRAGVSGRTIDLELQADCFSGAWAAHVANGGSDVFGVDDEVLDASVAGMIAISDAPGTAEDDPLAHGSGFDRIGAFQEGFDGGARWCADAVDTPRETVEFGFTGSAAGAGAPGDMPLEDAGPSSPGLLSLIQVDLNEFFAWLFDDVGDTWEAVDRLVLADPAADEVACDGEQLTGGELRRVARYCAEENLVLLDGAGLVPDLYEIGDFAVASKIAGLWARSAQAQLGVGGNDGTDLQADCLTGAWAASTFPGRPDVTPGADLQISAGDLDESIMGFLTYRDDDPAGRATVFERTDALRTGVLDGHRACEEFAPLG
ncbi:MAG TPA: neutral zinc metallopeptidase [Acidimicrobiales bacterium]